ncbi:hypothetical protein [Burkholderia pseudomallei]|uniref:hypothetical protein n=1 Tax=Burkholderia pseudomallei TaxID=28450 RepID=UPI0011AB8D9F|nr:hypothetical protein [Burkholderia pseudomallei]
MSHLRLVAGTDVTGMPRKQKRASATGAKAKSVSAAAPTVPLSAQKDAARKLILDYVVRSPTSGQQLSVRDWLDVANRALTTEEDGPEAPVVLYFSALMALDGMGIVLSAGGKSFGLEMATFATVLEPKKLVRHLPALKKAAPDLLGLPLY